MTAAADAPGCATCLAYHRVTEPAGSGECRRWAPRPGLPESFVWPLVDGDDWCLQHRQAAAPYGLTFVPSDAPVEPKGADDD